MSSITLKFTGDSVLKVQKFVEKLPEKEVEILDFSSDLQDSIKYLHDSFANLNTGKNPSISLEKFKKNTDKTLSFHDH